MRTQTLSLFLTLSAKVFGNLTQKAEPMLWPLPLLTLRHLPGARGFMSWIWG
jgi:hypothetical protein